MLEMMHGEMRDLLGGFCLGGGMVYGYCGFAGIDLFLTLSLLRVILPIVH